jgi:hypothetical protein
MDGWQRLWELVKCVVATVVGIGEVCSGNRCCNLVCYVIFDCNSLAQ